MNPKQLFRRATALLTAIAISVSLAVYSGTTVVNADSTQAQLESELADIKKKQDEIDKAIKETKGDISHEKGKSGKDRRTDKNHRGVHKDADRPD